MWTPDGRRIIFSSNRGGQNNLWWQAADGTGGTAERLTTSSNTQLVTGITPDGTAVVFSAGTPTMGIDVLQIALDGTRRVTAAPADEVRRTQRARLTRRSALPDAQSAGDRRERRADSAHRRATLGRGAEAPRAGGHMRLQSAA